MPKVHLLPQNLINQIAAGEVVERPASVLKELVENSLDAGATEIEITLKKAGRELICVADNGCGMSPEDAKLALERHATSKIKSFEDLTNVGTMGFRGEALPSIGSISYLSLATREKKTREGYEIRVEGGNITREAPCAASIGTRITVEHLFYNVPARRKFLKSDTTELINCVEIIKAIALANPEAGFTVIDSKRTLLKTSPKQTQEDRIGEVVGHSLTGELLYIGAQEGSAKLEGWISPIGKMQPTRSKMFFFVNRRPVDSKIFHLALREAYGAAMTRGQYPAAFLFLTIPAEEVDVNVHPAKREVRFRAERDKLAFLIQALAPALQKALPKSFAPNFSAPPPSFRIAASSNGLPSFGATIPPLPLSAPSPFVSARDFATPTQTTLSVAESSAAKHGWIFLGFLQQDWAIFQTPEGGAIVDMANAQERIAYEKVAHAFASQKTQSQSLLIPALLQLEPSAEETLKKNEKFIAKQGFVVSPFGKHCYRVEGVPTWLNEANGFFGAPETLLIEELATLSEGTIARGDERLKHQAIAKISAKHARSKISHPQAVGKLIGELLNCKNPLKTPEGAPTLWTIGRSELQKRFN